MDKNYYTFNQAFEMVAADSDSWNEPEYSEPKFSDRDQILKHFLIVLLMCYKCYICCLDIK